MSIIGRLRAWLSGLILDTDVPDLGEPGHPLGPDPDAPVFFRGDETDAEYRTRILAHMAAKSKP